MSEFTDRGLFGDADRDAGVRETDDGEGVLLDPDADDDQVDSAEADVIATGAYSGDDDDDDDEDDYLGV